VNGIQNKLTELRKISEEISPDIISIQETKLNSKSYKYNLAGYTSLRKDRKLKTGGGLMTYIKNNISFTEIDLSKHKEKLKPNHFEVSIIKLHLTSTKNYHIINIYIPPTDVNIDQINEDTELENYFKFFLELDNCIINGDINAHSKTWYSNTPDHRGRKIDDIILNSDHVFLNINTLTRIPFDKNQQETYPDVTIVPKDLSEKCEWKTKHALISK